MRVGQQYFCWDSASINFIWQSQIDQILRLSSMPIYRIQFHWDKPHRYFICSVYLMDKIVTTSISCAIYSPHSQKKNTAAAHLKAKQTEKNRNIPHKILTRIQYILDPLIRSKNHQSDHLVRPSKEWCRCLPQVWIQFPTIRNKKRETS